MSSQIHPTYNESTGTLPSNNGLGGIPRQLASNVPRQDVAYGGDPTPVGHGGNIDRTIKLKHNIVQWPMGKMPVELFDLIASYLDRQDVKALRLTCREFEDKVSSQYFRNVVVPFRSELYGNIVREVGGGIERATSSLFTNGLRIFESFGPHIRTFALSLEIDESALSFPPLKPIQKVVPAFWGVYRWPHETYHRYTDLEGIEATADEYQGMKQALRHLVNVTDLGLCCDAGLGYLLGPGSAARPDVSRLRFAAHQPLPNTQDTNGDTNFWGPNEETEDNSGEPREPREPRDPRDPRGSRESREPREPREPRETRETREPGEPDESESKDELESANYWPNSQAAYKKRILEAMCSEAGFPEGPQTDEVISLILEAEGVELSDITIEDHLPSPVRIERRSPPNAGEDSPARRRDQAPGRRFPLIPTHLTRPQKELLLELEWAHRALIQSYVISLIDLAGDGCFSNLTTLSITKIPSSHIHILYRNELWSGLVTLKTVSLGVLADWRRVTKTNIASIEDKLISPVEAVSKVFKLLHMYVGPQRHIERLDFEWICGGEFAPTAYQRNTFVLPAPIIESAELMVVPGIVKEHPEQLLRLPWVKHLCLKNCWASPHVLFQVLRHMALSSLETLELESVSLSGPPTVVWQPGLAQINLQHPNQPPGAPPAAAFLTVFTPPAAQQQPAGAPTPTFVPTQHIVTWATALEPPEERYRHAQLMSWSGILDHFSPGIKVQDMYPPSDDATEPPAVKGWQHDLSLAAPFVRRFTELKPDETRYGLRSLSVKSCGYALIDTPFINARATLPADPQPNLPGFNAAALELAQLMQNCKDKLCGRIMIYVRPEELNILENVFRMRTGWDGIYNDAIREAAINDGVQVPGVGRFTGTIVARDENPFASDYDLADTSDVPPEASDGSDDSSATE